MDVSAYSSPNLINRYTANIRTDKNEQNGLRPDKKDIAHNSKPEAGNEHTSAAASTKGTDKTLLLAASDPAKVNSLNESKDTQDAQAKASEEQEIRELRTTDREVRSHEAAHKAAGGRYAGAVSFEYQSGPDGQRYAVGGEVSIDISSEDTPEATIAKMQVIKAAAMAPANPSGQDRAVAAAASAKSTQAAREVQSEKAEEAGGHEVAGLQSPIKNNQTEEYQKNIAIVDAPSPTGKSSDETGFRTREC